MYPLGIHNVFIEENMSDNPLLQHMRQETVFVKLPSKGNFYKNKPNLTDDGEVGVMSMTSADEIAMKIPDALFNGESTYRVLKSCCPRIEDPREMPFNDVDAVLMAIRRATYGNELTVPFKCEKCDKTYDYVQEIDPILASVPMLEDQYIVEIADLKIFIRPIDLQSSTELQIQAVEQAKIQDNLQSYDGSPENIKAFQDSMFKVAQSNVNIISRCIYIIETPDGQRVDDPKFIDEWINNINVDIFNTIMARLLTIQTITLNLQMKSECANCKNPFEIPIIIDQARFFG